MSPVGPRHRRCRHSRPGVCVEHAVPVPSNVVDVSHHRRRQTERARRGARRPGHHGHHVVRGVGDVEVSRRVDGHTRWCIELGRCRRLGHAARGVDTSGRGVRRTRRARSSDRVDVSDHRGRQTERARRETRRSRHHGHHVVRAVSDEEIARRVRGHAGRSIELGRRRQLGHPTRGVATSGWGVCRTHRTRPGDRVDTAGVHHLTEVGCPRTLAPSAPDCSVNRR